MPLGLAGTGMSADLEKNEQAARRTATHDPVEPAPLLLL